MGILTNQESARSFSSYVTAFGLALLISSIIYLKRLDDYKERIYCADTEARLDLPPTCSQINAWRAAAIVGIVIGVIDALILPTLLCCIGCTLCGCMMCAVVGCPEAFSENKSYAVSSTTRNGDAELTETTTINLEDNDPSRTVNKYDVENVPSKLHVWLNSLGWILWVVGPFIATLYIIVSLYKYEAIRTRSDDLFESALILFVIALFNLMVYFQKFINSICGYGHKKITEKQ